MHVRTYISGSRCAWWQKTTNRHTHTGQLNKDNHVNTTLIKIGVFIFIGVAMQPEALIAATLAVSQERKSFTPDHTSILKIVHFNAQNVAQFDA